MHNLIYCEQACTSLHFRENLLRAGINPMASGKVPVKSLSCNKRDLRRSRGDDPLKEGNTPLTLPVNRLCDKSKNCSSPSSWKSQAGILPPMFECSRDNARRFVRYRISSGIEIVFSSSPKALLLSLFRMLPPRASLSRRISPPMECLRV